MGEKITHAHRWRIDRGLPIVAMVVGLAACSSSQPRLYLLNAEPALQNQRAERSEPGQSRRDVSAPLSGIRAGLYVTIPQYLDRPDILVRSDSYELARLSDARWAEDLSITASRVMAADLASALPGADIIAWPARDERDVNYRIAVDLAKFESDAHGNVEIEGRWALLDDRTGATRASGRFHHTKIAEKADTTTMVQTMSDLLAMTSAEIAAQIQTLRLANGTKTSATG